MDRRAVALVLSEIGMLLELHGENPFRARAFQNAARTLERIPEDIVALAESGELAKVKGFGPATAQVVQEILATGDSSVHQELRSKTPPGLIELLALPGLGVKRLRTLHEKLGIASLDDLEAAAMAGRIAKLPGFGEKTQQKLLEGAEFVRSTRGLRRQSDVLEVASWARDLLAAHAAAKRVEVAGELRRRMETVRRIDLVAQTDDPDTLISAFLELPGAASGGRDGDASAQVRLGDGVELRLVCTDAERFPIAWAHATAEPSHWAALVERAEAAGLRLVPDGVWRGSERVAVADEAALYDMLDLAYVEPELREGRGEVEAAAASELPRLVAYEDLRGCFHCHTTYSDGKATLREMAEAARARGWRYLGLADHSQYAAYAGGLKPDDIARQHEEIDEWNAEHGDSLWIFKGIEADILPDGRLDYADLDEDVLARFDYVVGSIHSSFGLSEKEQTERMIRAMENPHLTFLGHPTGRLLLSRQPYAINMDAIIDAAAERGVAIEINANPRRLDMDWRLWRRAKEKGVRTGINPDAHSINGLDDVHYGVSIARKGWLTADDVINAWEIEAVKKYFGTGRKR